jgi:zinc transport system permease protein
MVELLSYSPILKGLIVLLIVGFAFPITGVYLLRLNLLPLRFMLMHGAILGGAIALSMQFNPFATTMLVNLFLVLFMTRTSRSLKVDPGQISTFMMVISVSLAFIFIYKFNVPAKDTLTLLWGSLYSLSWNEVIGIVIFSVSLIAFQFFFRRQLRAVFFDREIAFTSGVNESALFYTIILLTSITVATAMKLIGALLLDALLLLPALIATFHAKSLRGVIVWSSIWGGLFAVIGYLLSLAIDIPASSSIAALASLVFLVIFLFMKK